MTEFSSLTTLAERLFLFLHDWLAHSDSGPSVVQMKQFLNVKSTGNVHRLLIQLEDRGFIARPRDRSGRAKPRAIMLLREPTDTGTAIIAWMDKFFPALPNPEEEMQSRFTNLLEEVVELGCAMGIECERVMQIVEACHEKSLGDFNDRSKIGAELADVEANVITTAHRLGIDAAGERRNLLERLNSKTPEYFAKRDAERRRLGL